MTTTVEQLRATVGMLSEFSLLKPHRKYCEYWKVETTGGTWIVPDFVHPMDAARSLLKDHVDGRIRAVEKSEGWVGWLAADGYTDKTDFTAYRSEEDMLKSFIDEYEDQAGV